MRFLKFFTTRNAFSREYGTWLIVLFNLSFVPVMLGTFSENLFLYCLSVLFFLLFRFEWLDYVTIRLQFSLTRKLIRSAFFLFISAGLFFRLWQREFLDEEMVLLISVPGILMFVLNLLTRRKKGKRQPVPAQILLVSFAAYLGALIHPLITKEFSIHFYVILFCNAAYYSCSVIYVRSKTTGAPYDVLAFLFACLLVITVLILEFRGVLPGNLFIVFLPQLIKTLDNVILVNARVPLRRIGLNETFHSLLYIALFFIVYPFPA